MSHPRRASRIRTIVLLLSGVLPLAIQPSALAGQIVASRNVDRMVAELPQPISIDELIRLLSQSAEDDSDSSEADMVPGDVMAVIAQCKLLSLMSDSVTLQAPDLEPPVSGHAVSFDRVAEAEMAAPNVSLRSPAERDTVRRLSDEQPLGP